MLTILYSGGKLSNNLLSICCVSYNHSQYIERCIQSIWNQDYKNIEILALDDGSSDNSIEVLYKLKETSPCPMTVISQKNTGKIGANFNTLINQAKGKYISIIACDDEFVPNSFLEKVNKMNENENLCFITSSKVYSINDKNEISEADKMLLYDINNPTADDLLSLEFNDFHSYYTQGAIYKTDLIKTVGAFDEDMICDDIVLRTKCAQYIKEHSNLSFEVWKKPLVYYRNHNTNISKNSLRQLKGIIEYLSKYWNNKKPPKKLIAQIKYAAFTEKDFSKVYEIFQQDDEYIQKLWNKYKNLMDKNQFLYKNFGIPFLFEIKGYVGNCKKTKIIKLFNHVIYKKEKTFNI